MRRRAFIPAAALAAPAIIRAGADGSVNVCRSLNDERAQMQRRGHASAILDPRVMGAVHRGMLGAIGVAYVEWPGRDHQRLAVPWTRFASPGAALGWLDRLAEQPPAWMTPRRMKAPG